MDLIFNISFIFFIAGLFFLTKKMQTQKKPEQIKTLNISLTNEEKIIRAVWMRSLYIFLFGNIAMCVGNYLFFAYQLNVEAANEVFIASLAATFPLAIAVAVIYGFAYVDFGTKWIKWILIVSPLKTAYDLVTELQGIFSIELTNAYFYYLLSLYFISTTLFIYFWLHCRRLYQLNCKIRDGFRAGLVV